jgi:hypothetical protein
MNRDQLNEMMIGYRAIFHAYTEAVAQENRLIDELNTARATRSKAEALHTEARASFLDAVLEDNAT